MRSNPDTPKWIYEKIIESGCVSASALLGPTCVSAAADNAGDLPYQAT